MAIGKPEAVVVDKEDRRDEVVVQIETKSKEEETIRMTATIGKLVVEAVAEAKVGGVGKVEEGVVDEEQICEGETNRDIL